MGWTLNHKFEQKLKKEIRLINPDIISGNTSFKADLICKLDCKAKKIIESHCAKIYTRIPANRKKSFFKDIKDRYVSYQCFRDVKRYSDAIVTLTQGDAAMWGQHPNIHIIPNTTSIDIQTISSCEAPRVIAAGRLTWQKGFDRLIDAWNIVQKRHPDWILDIFGEGFYKDSLARQIKDRKLEHSITIHPFTQNITQEYLNSSILALSSNYEGFGLVLIEAMSLGVPCVSFDCPFGPSEIIRNQEDGLLVKNGDIQGFANALCHLIEHEAERKAFGKRAKQNITRYSLRNIMPQWEILFHKLTEK